MLWGPLVAMLQVTVAMLQLWWVKGVQAACMDSPFLVYLPGVVRWPRSTDSHLMHKAAEHLCIRCGPSGARSQAQTAYFTL